MRPSEARLAASILVATLLGAANAQETNRTVPSVTLEPVTVRGYELPAAETPGSVGIISARDISVSAVPSLPNLFPATPGVFKTSDSLWGSDVNIRGLSQDSVVLLIDGCRVNMSTDINGRFGLLDPMEVERIEIIKGPISALYGSGSIGGVVNVVTRSGRFTADPSWGGGFSGYAMDNPLGGGGFAYGQYGERDWYAYASQTYRDFDSFEDGDGVEMRNSQFSDYQTKVKVGHRLTDDQRIEGQVQIYEGRDIGIPGSGTAPLPQAADVTYPRVSRELWNAVYTYAPERGVLEESVVNLFYQPIERQVLIDHFPPVSPLVEVKPRAEHDTLGGRWQNKLGLAQHTLMAGVDVWDRSLDSHRTRETQSGAIMADEPLPASTFLSSGAFAEDNWTVDEQLTLNAGGRGDWIHVENDANDNWEARSEDDASWNAHLGGTLVLMEALSADAIVARGYRAASLEERYQYIDLGSGVTKWGNPDLEPEESLFAEAGLKWTGKRVEAGVSAFNNDLDDLIAEQRVSPTRIENQNIQEARIYGLEGEARWRLTEALQLYGNASYAKGKDKNTDEALPGVAPLSGLGGVRVDAPNGWWAYSEVIMAAKQDDVPMGVEETDGWQSVNARVGYNIAGARVLQRVFVGVDNAFDETYRNYLTTSRGYIFNEPGRSLLAGYQASF